MSKHYPKLRVMAESGATLAREALHICFYVHRPHSEKIAAGLFRALDLYRHAVGPNALGMYADLEGEWQQLDAAGLELVRTELHDCSVGITELREATRGNGYVFAYFGKSPDAALVKVSPDAACAVYFRLPTEVLEEHGPEWVRSLALGLAAALPFSSGHAGLEMAGDLDLIGVFDRVAAQCFRYPGMDLLPLEHVSWEIGSKVRGPSWLTFLGQPALDGLGGVAALRGKLHTPGTTVEALDGGRAVITLGTWPEAGDSEQGNHLPAYRELARVLEPWLFREEHHYSLGFSPEDLLRWERRFLD
jgi:hypothetical protein